MFGITFGWSEDRGNVERRSRLFDLLELIGLSVLQILVNSR